MAPIEPDLTNSNLRPLVLFTTLGAANAAVIYVVLHRVLYRAQRALTPAQAVRERESRRRRHVLTFQGLAALSFGVALYYGARLLSDSYQVWAIERGERLPLHSWYEPSSYVPNRSAATTAAAHDSVVSLKLGRWFRDTSLLTEIYELALDRSSHQWWTQQLLLATSIWSTYTAIEGRRRNIPHLWAFIVLSLTVSTSFAQNLFFLAVLWSPVPLSEQDKHTDLIPTPNKHGRKPSKAVLAAAAKAESTVTLIPHRVRRAFNDRFPPKPAAWAPHPGLFSITLLVSVANVVLLAFAANTPSFRSLLLLYGLNLFSPHLFLRLAPTSWGTTGTTGSSLGAHDAFKATGILAGVIYAIQTVIAILDNSPPAPNRYLVLPRHQSKEERLKHPAYAISRVLGSVGNHPAIGRVAWDVLLCGLSLAVWAGVRGADIGHMLRATGWVTKGELRAAGNVKELVKKEVGQVVKRIEGEAEEPAPTTPRKGGRARKTSSVSKTKAGDEADDTAAAPASPAVARGKWSGEEPHEEDWESTAVGWGLLVLGGLGLGSTAVLGAGLLG